MGLTTFELKMAQAKARFWPESGLFVTSSLDSWQTVGRSGRCPEEREILIDNLLVRVHLIIEMSRPALRHGSLNSLFQVALYLPS